MQTTTAVRGNVIFVRRFEVAVVDGPDRGARATSSEASDELTVGSADGTDLRLSDPSISRHHVVVRATERGLELRDLGSTNGTFVGDVELVRGFIPSGTRVRLGRTTLEIATLADEVEHPLATDDRFGELLGQSAVMRRLYPILARCAASDASILIQGETGTGKELVAEAIHTAGPRRRAPFVVVDCGALPRQLTESELFGHVRGAFTGADLERTGAFEHASGGTIFLDEIGELPLDLQPLLLRALESRTIRKIGASSYRPIDVRVIAASHRELRTEVNEKRFRADLYYRLNVVRLAVPPLRERAGDLPLLADHFWRTFRPGTAMPPDVLADFARHDWPGNVRELRNAVERAALVGWVPEQPSSIVETYGTARERATWGWERTWIAQLVARCGGNISRAARSAQMGRSHLRRLMKRHDLHASDEAETEDE